VAHFPFIRRVGALVVAGVVLAACGGGSDEARPPAATVAPERHGSSSTTTTVDLGPPDAIDATYLDRVMDRADELLREAFASDDLRGGLDELYTAGQADKLAGQVAALGPGGIADPPHLPTTTVKDVITARPDCVFFTATRDLTPLVSKPFQQVQPYWIQLVPEPTDAGLPWRLAGDTYYADGSAPRNPCA
jgi:hypothetical protein